MKKLLGSWFLVYYRINNQGNNVSKKIESFLLEDNTIQIDFKK